MKKLGLSTIMMSGLLIFSGCSLGKDKDTTDSHIGEYKFEYISIVSSQSDESYKMVFFSCPATKELYQSSSEERLVTLCNGYKNATLTVSENIIESKNTDESEKVYYRLDEEGAFLLAFDENFDNTNDKDDIYGYLGGQMKF